MHSACRLRHGRVAADDGLRLIGCRISNSVKCVPPGNKPLPAEIATCNRYLALELAGMKEGTVLLALGAIAHGAVLRALGSEQSAFAFAHGAEHTLPRSLTMVDSYHCSRYNTNTRQADDRDVPRGGRTCGAIDGNAHFRLSPNPHPLIPCPSTCSRSLAALPTKPGVYRMLDKDEEILYVGKARHLRNRVSSYFHGRVHADKTMAMLAQVARVESRSPRRRPRRCCSSSI